MHIITNLYTVNDCSDRLSGLLNILESQDEFRPHEWGKNEHQSHKFPPINAKDMEALWARYGHMVFFRDNDEYWLQLVRSLWFPVNKRPDRLNIGIDESVYDHRKHTREFLGFSKDLFEWSNSEFGYISHKKEYNRQNKFPHPTRVHGKPLSFLGKNIKYGLPGIYWANFFGKTYVDWFGRDKFKTVPCYMMEELPNGGYLILTAESPLAYNEGRQFELNIKHHLGFDAFFELADPEKPLRSPFLDGTIVLE